MSIKKLKELQKQWSETIDAAAKEIDPKLIGLLFFDDLFNDHYTDNNLKIQYEDKVLPLVRNYKQELTIASQTYLLDFVNDMALILPNTGYLTRTGEETHEFKYAFDSTYIPCVEIQPVYDAIQDMQYDVKIRPFWNQNNYNLFGNNETVIITSAGTPLEFCTLNRFKFAKTFPESNLQRMERSVRIMDTFDYPINIVPLTKFEDDRIPGNYETAIRRHAILRKVLETETVEEESTFKSYFTVDGNLRLRSQLGNDY